MDGVAPGDYPAVVIYHGDENYTNTSFDTTIHINKYAIGISVHAEDIFVGQKARVNVTVEGVEDGVIIEIDGIKYTNFTKDGNSFIFEVDGLTAGDKTVVATFTGNDNYTFNSTTDNFTVFKINPKVNVSADPIDAGQFARIIVNGPSDITGYAVVSVNGTNYTVTLTQGTGHVDVYNLGYGPHDINIVYLENDKYLSEVNDTQLIVSRLNTTIAIDVVNKN